MKILIVGHGGREHALLRKLRDDAPDASFYITRGNGGTASLAEHVPISPGDPGALVSWADAEQIDLTVVGPEAPLADGIVDTFQERRLPIFGPTRAASGIEASKAFSKRLLREHGIPTAAFGTFETLHDAEHYIRQRGAPIVVKASGLAAGKGAIVCSSVEEAVEAAREMLQTDAFGSAGHTIVVEEFMEGEELSVFALCDGEHALPLLPSQDHKRLGEGDRGPNTGGMGAYAPVSLATAPLLERVQQEILRPTLAAMAAEGHPFRGLLYAGLMITDEGPRVVEFNARFGDPETQVVLPLMASSLLEPMLAIARGGSIAGVTPAWKDAAALTTVLAAAGYPDRPRRGDEIHVPATFEDADDVFVFHAGTRRVDGRLLTDGGRVLAVTAVAPTLSEAAERSRAAAESITFAGRQYRRDIGWRELARSAGAA
ncbi:MAG TPA: phosphoribosylamine--glycine ligase [Longimicrobiales bacterium]|nr:phosphoribosylamine--glycine ligase [Longimicrobiales bacterium]